MTHLRAWRPGLGFVTRGSAQGSDFVTDARGAFVDAQGDAIGPGAARSGRRVTVATAPAALRSHVANISGGVPTGTPLNVREGTVAGGGGGPSGGIDPGAFVAIGAAILGGWLLMGRH